MKKINFKIFIIYFSCLILFTIDRITKYISLNKLSNKGVYYFENFGLEHQINSGIAFSIKIPYFIILSTTFLIIFFLVYNALKKMQQRECIKSFLFSLIIIGAISNLIDRLLYAGVIDFIKIWNFPVFNLADAYITISIIIYILLEIKSSPINGTDLKTL